MPCILKLPNNKSKGLISFTTQERDNFILKNNKIEKQLKKLKNKWLLGIHHNWHDYKFEYNDLFDFHLAGKGDLKEKNNKIFLNSNIDCTNFVPNYFSFSKSSKHWDILFVGRTAFFKRLNKFFEIVRNLYDKKNYLRVLCIIVEKDKKILKDNSCYENYFNEYLSKFNSFERRFFNIIRLNLENPFDLKTLSQFYKCSRIYVHTSDYERRSRTTSYALASGIPVVCFKDTASIVNPVLQKKPFIYIAKSYEEFPKLIVESVNFVKSNKYTKKKMQKIINEYKYQLNIKKLLNFFQILTKSKYSKKDFSFFNFQNLDFRLGASCNSQLNINLDTFLNYLVNIKRIRLIKDFKSQEFELNISKYKQFYKKTTYPKSRITKNIYNNVVNLIKFFPFIENKLKKFKK